MSVYEIGQRWLSTMGLSDQQIELRAQLKARVDTMRATYGARPGDRSRGGVGTARSPPRSSA